MQVEQALIEYIHGKQVQELTKEAQPAVRQQQICVRVFSTLKVKRGQVEGRVVCPSFERRGHTSARVLAGGEPHISIW